MEKRPQGRPRKLTPAVVQQIVELDGADKTVRQIRSALNLSETAVRRALDNQRKHDLVAWKDKACVWPDSFGIDGHDLPWDAAADVIQLMRYCRESGLGAPTVRDARWYRRIRLATQQRLTTDGHERVRWLRRLASALGSREFATERGWQVPSVNPEGDLVSYGDILEAMRQEDDAWVNPGSTS